MYVRLLSQDGMYPNQFEYGQRSAMQYSVRRVAQLMIFRLESIYRNEAVDSLGAVSSHGLFWRRYSAEPSMVSRRIANAPSAVA